MTLHDSAPPRRRSRLLALLGVLVAVPLTLAGCASAAPAPGAASTASGTASGPWTFTDDLGTTIRLDHRPARIAGYNDVLGALLAYGVHPAASFGFTALKADTRFDGFDTKGITQVGTTYGAINLETLAAAKPDLVVVNAYPEDERGVVDRKQPLYGFKDLAQQQQVAAIAPIAVITMTGSGTTVIARTAQLATALGAERSVVAAAKQRFDTAATALTAAAKNGATVESLYAEADTVYVNKPKDDPTTRMYQELGVRMIAPVERKKNYYWTILSWENADELTGDVLLYSSRGYGPKELARQPTFASLPAVRDGGLHPGDVTSMDYDSQAQYMTRLAGWITAAKKA